MDDLVDDDTEVRFVVRAGGDAIQDRAVVVMEFAAQRKTQEFSSKTAHEMLALTHQVAAQFRGARNGVVLGGSQLIRLTPGARRVETFQRNAKTVELEMAGTAIGFVAMLIQEALLHRAGFEDLLTAGK